MPSTATNIRTIQRMFLIGGVAFFLALGFVMFTRSKAQQSIVATASVGFDKREDISEALDVPGVDSSEFQLRDFHRIETKDGQKIWEVRARDARYFAEEGLTHVDDASVAIYRKPNSVIKLEAKAAKLYLTERTMQRAELEGEINIELDKSLRLTADFATYDAVKKRLTVNGPVLIDGPGYRVVGKGLEMEIDNEQIYVRDSVESRFQPGAKAPEGLAEIARQG